MANSETYPVLMYDPAPVIYYGVTGSASGSLTVPGIYELGTGTGSAYVLSGPPYVGARVTIYQAGSATAGKSVITDASTSLLNGQSDRTATFTGEGQFLRLLGVSTTRWFIEGNSGVTTA